MIHDGTWVSAIIHLATRNQRLHYQTLLDELMGITREKPNVSKYVINLNLPKLILIYCV